jgi:hypothetical protein
LRGAREALRVKSSRLGEAGKKGGGVWLWSLPGGEADLDASYLDATDPHVNNSHLNNVVTLTRPEPDTSSAVKEDEHLEADELIACIGCGEPIPTETLFCEGCTSRTPPLVRMAMEEGASLVESHPKEVAPVPEMVE